jgi:hypothetical protein
MQITRTSMLSGKVHVREVDVTQEQLRRWRATGELIQDVMPHLSDSDREFLMTGCTDEEWDAEFKEETQ